MKKRKSEKPTSPAAPRRIRQRSKGIRGGKWGRRLPFVRKNVSLRVLEEIIPLFGRLAGARGYSAGRLFETYIFAALEKDAPETAAKLAAKYPELFTSTLQRTPRLTTDQK